MPRTALFLISLLHGSRYRDCFFSGAGVNTEKQSSEVLEDTSRPAVLPLSILHCYYTSVEAGRWPVRVRLTQRGAGSELLRPQRCSLPGWSTNSDV